MSFEGYGPIVMDHFLNPRNTGEVRNATHSAMIRNPVCGDTVRLTARVEGGVIREARTRTFGCAAAIAASSALTELITGKSMEEVRKLRNSEVVAFLGGLPEEKVVCSVIFESLIGRTFPP